MDHGRTGPGRRERLADPLECPQLERLTGTLEAERCAAGPLEALGVRGAACQNKSDGGETVASFEV
jgi:hypothetical protein